MSKKKKGNKKELITLVTEIIMLITAIIQLALVIIEILNN